VKKRHQTSAQIKVSWHREQQFTCRSLGPDGLKEVAQNSRNAAEASKEIIQKYIQSNKGLKILNGTIFNEFSLLYTQDNEGKINKLQELAQKHNILLGTKVSAPQESGFKGALTLAFTKHLKS
jgi:glycine cleavage system pyridoxal-binding protein P